MTALSLSLTIPYHYSEALGLDNLCKAEELDDDIFNTTQCRAFLLSIESLLHKQWRRYRRESGSSSNIPKIRPLDMDVTQPYFCRHVMGGREARSAWHGEVNPRAFIGSGGSGHLRDFIYRLLSYSRCSVECYPLTLVLIDRFFSTLRGKKMLATEYMAAVAHLPYVFAVVLLITAKFRDDHFRSNRYFSQIAELPLAEWNALERLVARVLQYDVHVAVSDYIAYEKLVLEEMARQAVRISILNSCQNHLHQEKHGFDGAGMSEFTKKDDVTVIVGTVYTGTKYGESEEEALVKEDSSFCSGGVTTSTISSHVHFSANGSPNSEAGVLAVSEETEAASAFMLALHHKGYTGEACPVHCAFA